MNKLPLHGIIPPIITPLINDNELDEPGLNRLINHLLDGGVHGIFLLGTTGEAPSLSYKLREKFINQACKTIDKKVPVIVGITDTSISCSVEMAHISKEAGADMVVLAPPYYFPVSQSEMCSYLDNLVPQLPLPFLLYNMPSHTKLHMTVDTVKHAKSLGARGVKDSSGDMQYFMTLIDAFKDSPEFSLIVGTEIYIPEVIMQGGHGAIAGGANMFPRLFTDFYNASVEKDYKKIDNLRQIVMKIYKTIYSTGIYSSRFIAGTKSALSVLEICNDYVANPMRKLNGESYEKIAGYVNEIKEMIEKEIV